jgi:2-hydroxyethylphosphonate dioxygenase
MRIDRFKLNHWTNARKLTPALLAERACVALEDVQAMLAGLDADDDVASSVARALRISVAQLDSAGESDLTVVWQPAEVLYASCRPIQRDGIHFYNYYTMAAPPGRVAPVILDILCPAGRLPALNNGHLEPAITVNLGPGHIYGRWGAELTPATWQVIAANLDADSWIVGESYVEPSYCPHAYSLAGAEPARIVSYTGHANLASLVEEMNMWSDPAFARFAKVVESGLPPDVVADMLLAARGHDRASAAAAMGIEAAELSSALADPNAHVDVLRGLGIAAGLDYRLLLPPGRRHDAVGKTYQSLAATRRSVREFLGYRVASMASAPHLPDVIGLFMLVSGDHGGYLAEPNETHYLAASGEPALEWADASGRLQVRTLGKDGSAWVGPFVSHRWTGDGAVLKLSSGPHLGSLDMLELTSTYAPGTTLQRGRRDLSGWGYDS